VNPKQVDVFASQPLETRFDRIHHTLATVSSTVRIVWAHVCAVFCCDDQAVSFRRGGGEFSQMSFAFSSGIIIRGIDEVAARFAK
jgi:hypothetical protein